MDAVRTQKQFLATPAQFRPVKLQWVTVPAVVLLAVTARGLVDGAVAVNAAIVPFAICSFEME